MFELDITNFQSCVEMEHRMKSSFIVVLILFGLGPCKAFGDDKPTKVIIAKAARATPLGNQRVDVLFPSAVPKTIALADATKWGLVASYDNSQPVLLHGVDGQHWSVLDTNNPNPSPTVLEGAGKSILTVEKDLQTVFLTLPSNILTSHVTSLMVSFDGAQFLWNSSDQTAADSCKTLFCAAPDKPSSDNYLSGLYSPANGSAAQYTIDAQGRFVKQIRTSAFYVGATATFSTNNRPSADPDSFLVSSLLQWIPVAQRFLGGRAQGVLVNWYVAGLEFDRQTTTKTFISSPIIEVPIRVYQSPKKKVSLGMFPYTGIETGTNLSNALMHGGSGFVFRGEAGTMLNLTIKTKWKYLSQIGITSNYTARIPAVDEIFTNTHFISATGKTVSLYSLNTQTRNHVKDELDLTVAKPFSITIKHEYGELPPGFRTVRNQVSIGLTVQLQQANGVAPKINPEK
jgi:hypothetical protein